MVTSNQKELIALEVIRTLHSQFEKFPEEDASNRNAPFHESFLKAFSEKFENRVKSIPDFISLASWMHGLNTSLGQLFIEKTAHILSYGLKVSFTKEKASNLLVSSEQKSIINRIVTDLTNGNRNPNLIDEDNECNSVSNVLEEEATDFTVDVFLENEEEVVCIELKTVRPNKGTFKAEKQKVLEAKLALKNKYPKKKIKYFIGFPFDPLDETATGYNKQRFMDYSVSFRKYFSEDEFLLSAELWDFLSDETQTMETILEIITKIATPEFFNIFNFLNDSSNLILYPERYAMYSKGWHLYNAEFIATNLNRLPKQIFSKNSFQRNVNQSLFSTEIKYRHTRIQFLINAIQNME